MNFSRYGIFSILGLVASLTGCTTYSSHFTCGQYPTSGCQPVSVVYNRTNHGFYDYRKELFKEKDGHTKAWHEEHDKKGKVAIDIGPVTQELNYIEPGDAVLGKPQTMRILFNSWQDKNKDLHAGGYVYVRLRDSQWAIQK